MTDNLIAYIDARAAELAAPQVTAALTDAGRVRRAAGFAVARREDLIAELWRRLQAQDRQLTQWREVTGCRSASEFAARQVVPPPANL